MTFMRTFNSIIVFLIVINSSCEVKNYYLVRGTYYYEQEQYDSCIKYLNKYVTYNSKNGMAYSMLARSHELNANYPMAIELYTRAIENGVKGIFELNNRGASYRNIGDYDKALDDYYSALKIEHNPIVINNIGIVYQTTNEHNKAVEYFRKALKIRPNSVTVLDNLGYSLSELDEHEEAIEIYSSAILANSKDPQLYNNRGVSYAELEEYDKAFNDFDKAIELDGNYGLAYENRGIYKILSNSIGGCRDIEKAIKLGVRVDESFENHCNIKTSSNNNG